MRYASNLVCFFYTSIVAIAISIVATSAKSCVDKCVQGELGKAPFFTPQQIKSSEKNFQLKVIMTSNTEIYSLEDLGIEYENIIFHTGLNCAQDNSKTIPPKEGAIIVSQDHQNQKRTTYLIFDYQQPEFRIKDSSIKASTCIYQEADTETLSYLSRLKTALLKSKETRNQDDSSKIPDDIDINITILPLQESDADLARWSSTSVTFKSSLALPSNNTGILLSMEHGNDLENNYNKSYKEPKEFDIFRKEKNSFFTKKRRTDIRFTNAIIIDKKEIKKNRLYFYENEEHANEILCVTINNNKAILYAQTLPTSNRTGDLLPRSKRVISTSTELEFFLTYNSISSQGKACNLIIVYMSDKNTISICYRPGTPEHYSISPDNHSDRSWEEVITSCWERNITDKFITFLNKNNQEDLVNAKLTETSPKNTESTISHQPGISKYKSSHPSEETQQPKQPGNISKNTQKILEQNSLIMSVAPINPKQTVTVQQQTIITKEPKDGVLPLENENPSTSIMPENASPYLLASVVLESIKTRNHELVKQIVDLQKNLQHPASNSVDLDNKINLDDLSLYNCLRIMVAICTDDNTKTKSKLTECENTLESSTKKIKELQDLNAELRYKNSFLLQSTDNNRQQSPLAGNPTRP
ncbi:MAG: hypothetical protein QS721_15335 [Candidatus Endonucleobacter sp. (ex Gigantidas childressi)]|nr:hypothetical protein [Candidatus Endonucleobacter sp. (ex Gigantidas childressi)]